MDGGRKVFANRHVIVWCPGCNVINHVSDADVLSGRGKYLDRHPGNIRLSELDEIYKSDEHHHHDILQE